MQNIADERIEQVEQWLRSLEKSKGKILGKVLYDAIKEFTEKSYYYDFSNIKENEFYSQLKPRIRYRLVTGLFCNFISNFFFMFNDDDFEAGCEFTNEFLINLKPNLFLSDNLIVDYGENFDKLYMIQESVVSLRLRVDKKHINEKIK